MAISAIGIRMFVVREDHTKLGDKVGGFSCGEKCFTKTGERISRRLDGCCFNVAVGTDLRNRPLARKELRAMAIQASCMFGELGDIRKSSVAFANVLPVLSGKLVTGITREFFFLDVC